MRRLGTAPHALLRIVSPLPPSLSLSLSLTCRLIITQQPRGDCFCSVRSRVYSLSHSGRRGAAEGGKGNMRARSQFAILRSYQMRRSGEREREGGRRGPQYLSAALHPISPPVYHARHGQPRAQADERRDGRGRTVAVGFVIISQFVSAAREKLELCLIGILYAVS